MTQTEILARAVAACKDGIRGRLSLFFTLGQCILDLAAEYRKQGKGKATGQSNQSSLTSLTMARQAIQQHLRDNLPPDSVPMDATYWGYASIAITCFTQKERDALIAGAVSYARVMRLMRMPDHGKAMVRDYANGKRKDLPAYWDMQAHRKRPGNPAFGRRKIQAVADKMEIDETGAVTVMLPDGDTDEFVRGLKSIVTQVSKNTLLAGLNAAIREAKRNKFGETLETITWREER